MSEGARALTAWTPDRRAFLLRKLHSLTGVVPVGAFLVEHLWTNATALGGQAQFDEAVLGIQRIPMLPVVETLFIFAPLTFHAVYGVWLSRQAKPNVAHYTYSRNWAYLLQRITGVLTFLFILVHLWDYRIQKWLYGMTTESFYPELAKHLSDVRYGVPWYGILYLVGVASAVFHFANGLVGFCASWGITTTRRAQSRATVLFGIFGFVLFLLGANTVLYFATGTRLYIPMGDTPAPSCAPDPSTRSSSTSPTRSPVR